jgi:hypothetical protein
MVTKTDDEVDGLWKVVKKGRVIFEGIESDARRWIADNYPRVHVQPGSPDPAAPDAVLQAPDGHKEVHADSDGTGFIPEEEYGE